MKERVWNVDLDTVGSLLGEITKGESSKEADG